MREYFKIIGYAIFLGLLSGLILIGIDAYTKEKIKKNQEYKVKSSVLSAFGIEYEKENIDKVFEENIEILNIKNETFYRNKDREIAFEISGSGLWGPISGIIALNNDLKTIKSIVIIHQEETPGLGGRIAEKEYLSKFKGKNIENGIKIVQQPKEINEVDAITGATGTSKAFEKILNESIKGKLSLLKGGF